MKVLYWLVDKSLGGFLVTGFFFSLKFYIDLPAKEKTTFYGAIVNVLNTQISFYKVILVFLVLWFVMWLIGKLRKEKNWMDAPKAKFLTYTTDKIGDSKWSWSYEWRPFAQRYDITNLKAHCPICDTEMERDISGFGGGNSWHCHECSISKKNGKYTLYERYTDVEKSIISKIKKM